MSLKAEFKKIDILDQGHVFEKIEFFPNISYLIIPFSVAFEKNEPPDIYNGEELIPFKEKDLDFKDILIHEFLND